MDPICATPRTLRTDDGVCLHATVTEPRRRARATVVLGHGHLDGRGQLGGVARAFRRAGMRTIAFDFRAHGKSEGDANSIGAREALDVKAAIAFARTYGDRVAYFGFSMGAAAYLLGATEADIAILDSPYDTLERAIDARARLLRWSRETVAEIRAEGVRALGIDAATVRPIDRVPHLRASTLFVFALDDAWIDAEVRARFAAALPGNARLTVVTGSHRSHHHTDCRARIVAFVSDALETIV
jgi:pimeloyl-ACP methyl ester carboxylesterase